MDRPGCLAGVAALAAAAGLCRLGRVAGRLGDCFGAGFPPPCRRTPAQYRPAGINHRAAVRRARGGAGLADRTQRPAGRANLGLASCRAACRAGFRSQLCLDHRCPRSARTAGRRAGVCGRLFPVSLPASGRCVAPARPRHGRHRRVARLKPLRSIFSRRAAAIAAGDLRRLAAGWSASAGRIRLVRHDPLRHLHDRHRRPVPVHLQRRRRPHAL